MFGSKSALLMVCPEICRGRKKICLFGDETSRRPRETACAASAPFRTETIPGEHLGRGFEGMRKRGIGNSPSKIFNCSAMRPTPVLSDAGRTPVLIEQMFGFLSRELSMFHSSSVIRGNT